MKTAVSTRKSRSLNPLHLPAGHRRMRAKLGKIGRIRTEMLGAPCQHCGAAKYQVVLHRGLPVGPGTLVGRCTRCRTQRDLDKEGMTAAVLFRYGLRPGAASGPAQVLPA